jgi:hypothetical protein
MRKAIVISVISAATLFATYQGFGARVDSSYYDQYVRLKRAMAEMELWEGNIPQSLLRLDKELHGAWVEGNASRAVELLRRGLEEAEIYKRWKIAGPAVLDTTGVQELAPALLTITIQGDQIDFSPTKPHIELKTGEISLYQIMVVNETESSKMVTVDSRELFRAAREISVSAGDSYQIVWIFRTMEVFPFDGELTVNIDGEVSAVEVAVTPEVDYRKPLVGTAIHIPGYGRFDRKRFSGDKKPDPKQVKQHPELFRPVRFEEVSWQQQEEVRTHYLSLRSHPSMLYRLPGDWDYVELSRDTYSWEHVDANIRDVMKLTKSLPVLYLGYQPWWVKDTRNPNGKKGLMDINNQDLLGKYREYVRLVAQRAGPKVSMYEMWNEPLIYWFYDGIPVPSGPRYVSEYGRLFNAVIDITAEELRAGDPGSWLISPGFADMDMFPSSWSMLKYLIEQGLLDEVDALCVHKYPLGVDVKPPNARNVREWVDLDYRTDESVLLQLLHSEGYDGMTLWCTELGGFASGRIDGSAYLRMGTILAHQGFTGLHFTSFPVSLNLLAEAIAGAEPAERGFCTPMDSDYSGVVTKFFTRGLEDVIIFWNNSEEARSLRFYPQSRPESTQPTLVQILSEPIGGPATRELLYDGNELDNFFETPFQINPLEWKAFLIISIGSPEFNWIASIQGAGSDFNLFDFEQAWKEARSYQWDIFSGDTGSSGNQRAFKEASKAFRKAWLEGQVSNAQRILDDMIEIGRRVSK